MVDKDGLKTHLEQLIEAQHTINVQDIEIVRLKEALRMEHANRVGAEVDEDRTREGLRWALDYMGDVVGLTGDQMEQWDYWRAFLGSGS